jgi:predicted transcriptional regulator
MSKETISVRLAADQKAALDALASKLDMNRSDIVADAVRAYLEVQEWQVEEIKKAVREADEDRFASDDEVNAFFAKWISSEA